MMNSSCHVCGNMVGFKKFCPMQLASSHQTHGHRLQGRNLSVALVAHVLLKAYSLLGSYAHALLALHYTADISICSLITHPLNHDFHTCIWHVPHGPRLP